jgi:ABC-2 type transport system ATP-binding protein
MNALELNHVSKRFPGFSLEDLSLTLPSGCILGLIGENGAGKSTTIKLILNMIALDSGSITILGRDSRENARLVKADIGVVLDEVGFPGCLTTTQISRIMSKTFRNWDEDTYQSLLQRLAIPTDRKFKDFSRGNKMKLGIAVALSHHPKLLILDEATNGLDPVVRDEVVNLLFDFTRAEDHSILISSHIVSDLEKLCDYIALLHNGRLMLCAEKDALLEDYGILHATADQLAALDRSGILGRKENAYGAEVLMRRADAPTGLSLSPVSIEDLFVFMVKEVG